MAQGKGAYKDLSAKSSSSSAAGEKAYKKKLDKNKSVNTERADQNKSTSTGKAHEKKSISRSSRAGLQSQVSAKSSVGTTAVVYSAVISEYLTVEILELAGNTSKDMKLKRINLRRLQLAIRGDEELDNLVRAPLLVEVSSLTLTDSLSTNP